MKGSCEGACITQIVPRLPPLVDGVGDYATYLAQQLHKDYGYKTRFIVGDLAWRGESYQGCFPVNQVAHRSAAALLSSLPDDSNIILLHYVGYGYEKRGCPEWLVDGLERWRKQSDKRMLIAMFHEVYAFGPFWTSSFWLSSTQKKLAARIARVSSRILTNREEYSEILRKLAGDRIPQIYVLPVFSNVGEPEQLPPPLLNRRRRLVVFGSRGHRQLVFKKSLGALQTICRNLRIEEIFDIGALVEHGVMEIDGISVTRTGIQPADSVSALLLDATVGVFNYPADYLSKSTIFAAYCAHRLLPIGFRYCGRIADGLHHNRHFWLVDRYDGDWNLSDAQRVADNAYDWYQGHNLSKQAKVFAAQLEASAS